MRKQLRTGTNQSFRFFLLCLNKHRKSRNLLQVPGFLLTFALANITMRNSIDEGREDDSSPDLIGTMGFFDAHTVRWREAACRPSSMRERYGGRLPRVFSPSGATHVMFAAGRAAAFLVPYRQKRARRFRAKANITCSMQQTINLGQVVQPSVLSSVGSIVKNWRQQVKSWVSAHREQLECYVGGPLIVVFCAALIYVAAVLQGGAQ